MDPRLLQRGFGGRFLGRRQVEGHHGRLELLDGHRAGLGQPAGPVEIVPDLGGVGFRFREARVEERDRGVERPELVPEIGVVEDDEYLPRFDPFPAPRPTSRIRPEISPEG